MKSLEHLIYDILLDDNQRLSMEDIGVIGRDKPVGMPQGGFSPSFSSFHPNSTVNRKRNAAQQKNAQPIASFESGNNKKVIKTLVPNQGDAQTVGDLSARGAAQEGGKNPYKSIKTKLKEMYFVEDDTNTIVKKKTTQGQLPSKEDNPQDIKNSYHDLMSNLSQLSEPKKSSTDTTGKEVHPMPVIPVPSAGLFYNLHKLLNKPLETMPLPKPETPSPSVNPPAAKPSAPTTNVKPPQAASTPKPQGGTSQSGTGPQSGSGTSTQTLTRPETEFKPYTEPKIPEFKPYFTPEPTFKPEIPKPDVAPKPEVKPEVETKPEIKPEVKSETKPAAEPKPSTATETPTKPETPSVSSGGSIAKSLGAGGLAGLLAGMLGGGQKPSVQPSGFIHPGQSQISGFSFSPLGMATNMAQKSPGLNTSHILSRLKLLLPAEKQAEKAGGESNVTEATEETMNENLDKERKEVENVARKDFLKNRSGKSKGNSREAFSAKSVLSRNGAIKTRIIDENTRINIIKEAMKEKIKGKNRNSSNSEKTEKMTVGGEKTPVDVHPVLKSPQENQWGRAN